MQKIKLKNFFIKENMDEKIQLEEINIKKRIEKITDGVILSRNLLLKKYG